MKHVKSTESIGGSGNRLYTLTYLVDDGRTYNMQVGQNVFWNCQNCAIGGVEDLLDSCKDETVSKVLYDAIIEVSSKLLGIIDIHQNRVERIEKLPDITVISKAPYESTNGSKMCILVIKPKFYS